MPTPPLLRPFPRRVSAADSRRAGSSLRAISTPRAGFTLIELLIVIGILLVLISILVPVVGHLRVASYEANTKNEISQIASACQRYYDDFHAYPGPVGNTDIEKTTTSIVDSSSTAISNVTGAENLLLGLTGGLKINPTAGQPPMFVPSLVGTGPQVLNANDPAPKHYQAYLAVTFPGSSMVSSGTGTKPFTDLAGRTGADSAVPEFVDQFPNPLPILYYRARTGVGGVVSDGTIVDPITSKPAIYNYDTRDNLAYLKQTPGLGIPSGSGGILVSNRDQHGLQAVGTLVYTASATTAVPVNTTTNAGQYFLNQTIQPTTTSDSDHINKTGTPRQKDAFIIISAGRDRTYGTGDDVSNFGDVNP